MTKEAYYNGIAKKAATAWKRSLRVRNITGSFDDARRAMNRMHQIHMYNDKLANRPKPILDRFMQDKRLTNQLFSAYQDISKDFYDATHMILKNPEIADRVKNPYMRNKLRQLAQYFNNPGYLTLPRNLRDTTLVSKLMSKARKKLQWIPQDKLRKRILKSDIIDKYDNPYEAITEAWNSRGSIANDVLRSPEFLKILQ